MNRTMKEGLAVAVGVFLGNSVFVTWQHGSLARGIITGVIGAIIVAVIYFFLARARQKRADAAGPDDNSRTR